MSQRLYHPSKVGGEGCAICEELRLAAARFGRRRADAEATLICAVLPDPARAVPIALRCRLRPIWFTQEDLRIIWCACEVAHHLNRAILARIIFRGLNADGYWSQDGSINSGPIWNEKSLVMAMGQPATGQQEIERCVANLSEVAARQDRAGRLLNAAQNDLREARDVLLGFDRRRPSHPPKKTKNRKEVACVVL